MASSNLVDQRPGAQPEEVEADLRQQLLHKEAEVQRLKEELQEAQRCQVSAQSLYLTNPDDGSQEQMVSEDDPLSWLYGSC